MPTYLGPLLLVLAGLGGLVVVFGRRLKLIRTSFQAVSAKAAEQPSDAGVRRGALLTRTVAQGVATVLRFCFRTLRGVGRGLGRLFQRPPIALRVPRLARLRSPVVRGEAPAGEPSRGEAKDHSGSVEGILPRFSLPTRRGLRVLTNRGEARARLWGRRQQGPKQTPPATVSLPQVHHPGGETDAPELEGSSKAAPAEVPEVPVQAPPADTLFEPLTSESIDLPRSEGEAVSEGVSIEHAPPLQEETPGVPRSAPPPTAAAAPPAAAPTHLEAHVQEQRLGKRKVVGRVRARKRATPDARRTTGERRAVPEDLGSLGNVPTMLEKGHFAAAESFLVERLAGNPRDLEAYRLLGLLYIKRGDFTQAREVFEEALRRSPDETSMYGLLGETYVGLSQYSKALHMYQRAHGADEQNLEYLEQLLRISLRMDHRPLVKVTAEKILALEPDHVEAKEHLARMTAGT